jgi:hypothetical protein
MGSDRRWVLLMLAAFTAALTLNLTMIRWFASQRGWSFALAVIPLRLLYYTLHPVSVLCGLWLALRSRLLGNRRAGDGRA